VGGRDTRHRRVEVLEEFFLDRGGRPIPETVRLAGNVLVWQQGDVLIRSESALPLDRALRIAQSVG